MASFQDEFFEYFRKRLENEERSSPKGVPDFDVEDLLRDLGKDGRDFLSKPAQAEFDMERDLGKDMRDWRDRPNPPGRINPGEQMGFPGGQFRQAMKPDNRRAQLRRQQYIQDLVRGMRGGFEDRPSTFTSIKDILSTLAESYPALKGLKFGKGAVDPMINAVRGQGGVQKLLFPPSRSKGD